MDEKDFVFVNKPLSDEEEKAFSNFLKSHKTKAAAMRHLILSRTFVLCSAEVPAEGT